MTYQVSLSNRNGTSTYAEFSDSTRAQEHFLALTWEGSHDRIRRELARGGDYIVAPAPADSGMVRFREG